VSQPDPDAGHGFGEHEPPWFHVCELSPHAFSCVTEHDPVMKLQQIPSGPGHVFGEHVPPAFHVLPLVQFACDTSVHPPSVAQHEPVAGGHVFGVHVPASVHVLPVVQFACRLTAQAAVVSLQHLPLGCVHVFGVHVPPCVHTAFPVQVACVPSAHAPVSVLQHLPVGGGHGFVGVHVAPAMNVVPCAQFTSRSAVQFPVVGSQHAPSVPTSTVAFVTVIEPCERLVLTGPHCPFVYAKWSNTEAPGFASVTVRCRPVNTVGVYRNLYTSTKFPPVPRYTFPTAGSTDAVSFVLGVPPTPYPDHVPMFDSPCGSIPGTPSIWLPASTPAISPISWFPGVFVNDDAASVFTFPLKIALIPARYVYAYAMPPEPTAEFVLNAAEYVWSGALINAFCSVPFASGSPVITMSNPNELTDVPVAPPTARACTAKSST
jgi:hypothetical protein